MTASPVTVLYIGGTGRTGSTVLEKILAQAPGVFAGGELTFLWRFRDSGRCSCGAPITSCAVWRDVFREAYGGFDGIDPSRMVRLRRRFRSVHLPLMVSSRMRGAMMRRLEEFPERVANLYQAIASVTGSRIVVDSSKEPHYSSILRSRPELDVRFLHLVRDPRAVAYSWSRRRRQLGLPGDEMMESRGALRSAAYYSVSNLAAEALWSRLPDRYLRMRYEDLVADPEGALERIEGLVGARLDVPINGGAVETRPTHSAWGNPNRFESGSICLQPDTEWQDRLSRGRRVAVGALTYPWRRRYGYLGPGG